MAKIFPVVSLGGVGTQILALDHISAKQSLEVICPVLNEPSDTSDFDSVSLLGNNTFFLKNIGASSSIQAIKSFHHEIFSDIDIPVKVERKRYDGVQSQKRPDGWYRQFDKPRRTR